MANRTQTEESSLELLLDTITNSFGGIVFIAILTILLLQQTSPEPQFKQLASSDQRSELIRSQTALSNAEAELSRLQKSLQSQAQTTAKFTSAESEAEHRKIQTEREEIARLKENQRRAVEGRAELQEKENEVLADRANLEKTLRETQEQANTLALKLKDLERTRSKDAPIPRTRQSNSLGSVPLILKNKKLYFARDYSRGFTFANFNTADFLIIGEESEGTVYAPNPTKGYVVQDERELETYLQRKLALVDMDRFHMDLAVWNDSFAEFQLLKSCLIRMKIQYRTIIFENSETLRFGSSDRTVQ